MSGPRLDAPRHRRLRAHLFRNVCLTGLPGSHDQHRRSHHGVEAFVNMSQMTVTQMSITETTDSPQHKLHWLAEQALSWSGLPVVTVRPTVFLEGFFLQLAAPGVRASDELALPMGGGKTSPISAVDVVCAVAVILDEPAPHIGQIYNLTGPDSADLEHYARVASSPKRSAGPSDIATFQSRRGANAFARRSFPSTLSG